MNDLEGGISVPRFVLPSLEHQEGELDRVAETFSHDNPEEFRKEFMEKFYSSALMDLSADIWSRLENTDSFEIAKGDWERVREHAEDGHPESPRDWRAIKNDLEGRGRIYAPIIVQIGETLHLMSGNTRLMVARAAGVTPKVVLVKMSPQN